MQQRMLRLHGIPCNSLATRALEGYENIFEQKQIRNKERKPLLQRGNKRDTDLKMHYYVTVSLQLC